MLKIVRIVKTVRARTIVLLFDKDSVGIILGFMVAVRLDHLLADVLYRVGEVGQHLVLLPVNTLAPGVDPTETMRGEGSKQRKVRRSIDLGVSRNRSTGY